VSVRGPPLPQQVPTTPPAPWGGPANRLLFHCQEGGKALWRFLLKRRDPAATVYVIADQGGADRRALSLALAVADVLGLPRGEALFNVAEPDTEFDRDAPAPCEFVYSVARAGRAMVIA
jgi:hypothetical protein